jgi:hypothetical protein
MQRVNIYEYLDPIRDNKSYILWVQMVPVSQSYMVLDDIKVAASNRVKPKDQTSLYSWLWSGSLTLFVNSCISVGER